MAREWFYFDNAKLIGPFTDAGLKVLVQEKVILPETILKTGDRQCFAGDVRGLFPSPVAEPVLNPKPKTTNLLLWVREHHKVMLFCGAAFCLLFLLAIVIIFVGGNPEDDRVAQKPPEAENQINKMANHEIQLKKRIAELEEQIEKLTGVNDGLESSNFLLNQENTANKSRIEVLDQEKSKLQTEIKNTNQAMPTVTRGIVNSSRIQSPEEREVPWKNISASERLQIEKMLPAMLHLAAKAWKKTHPDAVISDTAESIIDGKVLIAYKSATESGDGIINIFFPFDVSNNPKLSEIKMATFDVASIDEKLFQLVPWFDISEPGVDGELDAKHVDLSNGDFKTMGLTKTDKKDTLQEIIEKSQVRDVAHFLDRLSPGLSEGPDLALRGGESLSAFFILSDIVKVFEREWKAKHPGDEVKSFPGIMLHSVVYMCAKECDKGRIAIIGIPFLVTPKGKDGTFIYHAFVFADTDGEKLLFFNDKVVINVFSQHADGWPGNRVDYFTVQKTDIQPPSPKE